VILTKASLNNPVAVAVGAILAVIFGILSLLDLPIQLTPDVERPRISIRTNWRAAAPNEVESELLEPQENALRGLPGLRRMVAQAEQGNSDIDLEFGVEANMQEALIEVINRLNQVPSYPVDVDEPRITVGSNNREDSIAWYSLQTAPGNDRHTLPKTLSSRVWNGWPGSPTPMCAAVAMRKCASLLIPTRRPA